MVYLCTYAHSNITCGHKFITKEHVHISVIDLNVNLKGCLLLTLYTFVYCNYSTSSCYFCTNTIIFLTKQLTSIHITNYPNSIKCLFILEHLWCEMAIVDASDLYQEYS